MHHRREIILYKFEYWFLDAIHNRQLYGKDLHILMQHLTKCEPLCKMLFLLMSKDDELSYYFY